ncbi:hypothetical protein [Kitasatospora sp. NPDC056181]|uniref:hypothetical protein n=1 Tax=Kitasatospora sp. NPDC056181 TaxID=3345737 RepID=UPI0035D6F4E0
MSSEEPAPAGVRDMVEVAAAIARLAGGPQPLTPAVQGVAAYEWAAGRRPVAPVSGALLVGDLPSDDQLQGEERAALRRVHKQADIGPPDRDFGLGVVRALAWLIGYSGNQP